MFMVISKATGKRCDLMIYNTPTNRISQLAYLGTIINKDWDNSEEIRSRIEKARASFNC